MFSWIENFEEIKEKLSFPKDQDFQNFYCGEAFLISTKTKVLIASPILTLESGEILGIRWQFDSDGLILQQEDVVAWAELPKPFSK